MKNKKTPIDFERFCSDFRIEISPSDHKHNREGWLQIECPFCTGNFGYHLGYNTDNHYCNCWRCGWHSIEDVISKLIKVSFRQACEMRDKYRVRGFLFDDEKKQTWALKPFRFPVGTKDEPKKIHKRYLKSRQFDIDELMLIWGLKFTGPVGPYKFRVIAPVTREEAVVSYQGRDVTGKSPLRYKACPQEIERVPHKHCLYGLDQATQLTGRRAVIVCEGITDVWRLGPGAVATFGIEYTTEQVKLLSEWSSVFVFFDSADRQAQEQGGKLASTLSLMGVEVVEISIDGVNDPAELSRENAQDLRQELLGL